ncbi:DUF1127 domain-containing protein [Elioraea sp.]|uniref:DUF1127 domain-containing protein n=1 Tax=Elioraea sp. TaxID=2185103 RepID=UPI0021DE6D42|nr:DUF1127 domain-containing protein [Elioraea sp.]GIX10958.1 MAG: hypothetical protein KatS3mg116_2668 [Elioraea sp.]
MDARITKEETALLLNLSLPGHAQRVEEIRLAALRARDEAIGRAIRAAVIRFFRALRSAAIFIATFPQRRAVFEQLNALSDRELADIGLTRGDLVHVFDEDFVRAREAAARAAALPPARPPVAANSNRAMAEAA